MSERRIKTEKIAGKVEIKVSAQSEKKDSLQPSRVIMIEASS